MARNDSEPMKGPTLRYLNATLLFLFDIIMDAFSGSAGIFDNDTEVTKPLWIHGRLVDICGLY